MSLNQNQNQLALGQGAAVGPAMTNVPNGTSNFAIEDVIGVDGRTLDPAIEAHKVPTLRVIKVPRPPNAFILYRQCHHNRIVAENPGIHNNHVSIKIGTAWRNECQEIRAHFFELANAKKREFHAAHPGYQYRPRKAADKKRRARRNAEPLGQLGTFVHEVINNSPVEETLIGPIINAAVDPNKLLDEINEIGAVLDSLIDGDPLDPGLYFVDNATTDKNMDLFHGIDLDNLDFE
ncbi:MAG: hypothetical protein M1829_001170 [Trizodia sp. TS-e1964]|nr:MAG: hypothetical protein M1829_001170 [Trizodia sp. TS-e1964]